MQCKNIVVFGMFYFVLYCIYEYKFWISIIIEMDRLLLFKFATMKFKFTNSAEEKYWIGQNLMRHLFPIVLNENCRTNPLILDKLFNQLHFE